MEATVPSSTSVKEPLSSSPPNDLAAAMEEAPALEQRTETKVLEEEAEDPELEEEAQEQEVEEEDEEEEDWEDEDRSEDDDDEDEEEDEDGYDEFTTQLAQAIFMGMHEGTGNGGTEP